MHKSGPLLTRERLFFWRLLIPLSLYERTYRLA
jgi:hypothetical protein